MLSAVPLTNVHTGGQTHERDAVCKANVFSRKPVTLRTPYTVTSTSTPVKDITRVRQTNLVNAMARELNGHSPKMDTITAHGGVHFYGHLLKPGQAVALRAPASAAKAPLSSCVRVCAARACMHVWVWVTPLYSSHIPMC